MTKETNLKHCNTIRQYKESNIEQGIMGEVEWQRWQASYAAKRRKIFLEILETGKQGHKQ